jgi:hypothetical protein
VKIAIESIDLTNEPVKSIYCMGSSSMSTCPSFLVKGQYRL